MEARPRAMYLSHGGGPCFFMKGEGSSMSSQMGRDSEATKWYKSFTRKWPKPRAIVVVSAHWEESGAVSVTNGAKHPLYYDYYGFPDYTYELDYDCPGDPALANKIIALLREGRIPAKADERRGYDHGVFIPLKLMYPEADIPVIQVSLLAGLSAEKHLEIGQVLRGLAEDEGLLLIGSGQATHNLRSMTYPGYGPGQAAPREAQFVEWLKETATRKDISPADRRLRLTRWAHDAPYGRLVHPREEHLLPMHVVSGYMGFTPGKMLYDGWVVGGMSLACVGFWDLDTAKGSADAESNAATCKS